ncbi:hypothetical protein VISI1226_10034 [Vibrio sinaloensis DSM 21326]|uniref:Lipoprotein n=1 Tax=Vibrio sinaloensis DSM 21326 TaxID=945550 RepID=E8M875_PHOS4|nr:hypothetical protein [Vibrio sinaloensis]EGA69767.1 hypothetical protein VISI1226_10034 [Vibrio sinaloensis DSM 21326]
MYLKSSLVIAICTSLLVGCGNNSDDSNKKPTTSTNHRQNSTTLPVLNNAPIASVSMTDEIPEQFAVSGISKYVKITPAANRVRSAINSSNDAIHIIATDDGVNGEKIRRAAMILQHLLTNSPDTLYGDDKASIVNSMAQRNATLMLTADDTQNQLLMTQLFVKQAVVQGELENWVKASEASTLEGLIFTSEKAFIESLMEYGNQQSEDDFDAVISSLIEGIIQSNDTPQWLLNSQSLMYRELSIEGDCHYMSNYADYCADLGEHADRDAAFEEILHLVQAQGIAPNSDAKLKQLQADIDARALSLYNAHKAGQPAVWQPTDDSWQDWLGDDFNPDVGTSYSHEYFAAAFEAYMGVAQHNGHGLDGYQALTREQMDSQDPQAKRWISELFHDHLQYTARIDSEGVEAFYQNEFAAQNVTPTFKMNRDDSNAQEGYTYKSQWLVNAQLIGDKAINLVANAQNNTLKGNISDNLIDGKEGVDTYLVDNALAECAVAKSKHGTLISCPSTGNDELLNIEAIRFTDQTLDLTQ